MKLLFIRLQFKMHKTFLRSKFHFRPPFVGTVFEHTHMHQTELVTAALQQELIACLRQDLLAVV